MSNITPMSIVGVHHVQLAMPAGGEDDARCFYSGLLEIPEVQKPAELAKRGGAWFETSAVRVHQAELAKRGGAWFETSAVRVHLGVETDFRPARKAHPGLLVENLESLVMRLRDAGYEVIGAEPMPGYNHIYVHDPFGNRLELLEAHRP